MVSKDNVLITITTAANMGGLEQAKAGLLGLNAATLGLTAVVAGMVMAGKSAIEITEKQNAAHRSLEQAVNANNAALGKHAPVVVDVTKQTDALEKAERRLAEVEAGMPTKHKATKLELMHLQDAQLAVADAQEKLTAAQKAGQPVLETSFIDMKKLQTQIDTFINSNRRYISSQSEVEDSYGALIRSGIPLAEVEKDMNRAVDLAALKNLSLTEATDLLIKAEQGRFRGLIDLGVSSGKYTDAQGNLINGTKDVARAMGELDPKLKDGRHTYTELDQATRSLGITWQQFATTGGAADKMIGAFTTAVEIGDLFLQFLQDMGHDNAVWDAIQDRLFKMGKWLQQYIIQPAQDAWDWLYRLENQGATPPDQSEPNHFAPGTAPVGKKGRASGGAVLPGRSYDVGETAMETLTMFPGGGGYVTPTAGGRSGGGHVHVHLDGIYAGDGPSLDILANKIALRLGYATGR